MMEFVDLKTQQLAIKNELDLRISTVLAHGKFIMGPEVFELEDRLSTFTGAKHCITVASGTDALLISLMALGITRGDEVITSPFTFAATAEVIALLGAKPVFVDINPITCNIDANKIRSAFTQSTKAIMPVSLFGQPSDMDEINAIAMDCGGIPVIEDAAQSFGATYKNKKSCNLSTIGCTSFFPSKPLGCYGDGGAIFTNDSALAKACREIRVHGQSERYFHNRLGVGGRMDTLQCAIVLAKLERFGWELEQRILIGARYTKLIRNSLDKQNKNTVITPQISPGTSSVFGQYTIQVEKREVLLQKMVDSGVPTAIHYPKPLHLQPAFASDNAPKGKFPVAEHMASRVLSLPFCAYISPINQNRVVEALHSAINTL
jgi:UDP-2-acetamido-2-deoxy-ribo-hexuluronate aminotransferase